MIRRIRLIYTGITRHPSAQIHALLRSWHPDCEIDTHVVTWAGMNDPRFFEVFNFATIHQHDYTRHRAELEALTDKFGFKFPETVAHNTLSMFAGWSEAAPLADDGWPDIVFKARVDNALDSTGSDTALPDNGTFSVPAGADFRGGLGDHICFGQPADVAAYLRLFQHLSTYAAEGHALHPERMVALHVSRAITQPVLRPPWIILYRDGIYDRPASHPSARHDSTFELTLRQVVHLYRPRNLLGGRLVRHLPRLILAGLLRLAVHTKWVSRHQARLKAIFPLK